MPDVVLLDAVRSPLGAVHGAFAQWHPVALLAATLAGLERAEVPLIDVREVIVGCVEQVGAQGGDVARAAVLAAGWPVCAGGTTVDRGEVSGLAALAHAAAMVRAGVVPVAIAAAVDVPSLVPPGAAAMGRYPYGRPWEGADDRHPRLPPGRAPETLGIPRDRQDAWAARSAELVVAATAAGAFAAEIVAVGEVAHDEMPAARSALAATLADLPPMFDDDGTLTAANRAPDADGAAAMVVADAAWARARGLAALATIDAVCLRSAAPDNLLDAATAAARGASDRAGRTPTGYATFELPESSAALAVALARALGLDDLLATVNSTGGALALGEPAATSALRAAITLAHRLRREGLETGLALGAGLGQGAAIVLRRTER
jgi:acetyl-CoA acetyltransferase family protein